MSSGKTAVFVMGPAGSGKSSLCGTLLSHTATAQKRSLSLFNLDPAAEECSLSATPSLDIRDLVTLEEAMEEAELGPNGALLFCFEYLLDNLDWLTDALDEYFDDDESYILVDCPGQLELYTHYDILPKIISTFQQCGFNAIALYLVESNLAMDGANYVAAVLSAMSAMCRLNLPHLNVLTKMDLVLTHDDDDGGNMHAATERHAVAIGDNENDDDDEDDEENETFENTRTKSLFRKGLLAGYSEDDIYEALAEGDDTDPLFRLLHPDSGTLRSLLSSFLPQKFTALNEAILSLLDEHASVGFIPLNIASERSIGNLMDQVDMLAMYYEGREPRDSDRMEKLQERDDSNDNFAEREYDQSIDVSDVD